jgi:methylenetetrahydrofolate reductase (NADPH)
MLTWTKPFVEIFLPSADWTTLKRKFEQFPDEITFFAANAAADFESTDATSVHPVTWGTFSGKEYVFENVLRYRPN